MNLSEIIKLRDQINADIANGIDEKTAIEFLISAGIFDSKEKLNRKYVVPRDQDTNKLEPIGTIHIRTSSN